MTNTDQTQATPVTIRHILVTTDLSNDAVRAYPLALSLARGFGARITLLCCIDTSTQFGVGGAFDVPVLYVPEALAAVRDRTTAELTRHAQQFFSGAAVDLKVVEAPAAANHTIVEFVKGNDVDLTIIASHGRSGVARAFLGSVAELVLRHSPKPVLVVPVK